jgi:hypothetical protein
MYINFIGYLNRQMYAELNSSLPTNLKPPRNLIMFPVVPLVVCLPNKSERVVQAMFNAFVTVQVGNWGTHFLLDRPLVGWFHH